MAAVKDALDPSWINAPGGVGPSYDAEELRRLQGYQLVGGATPGVSRTGLLDSRSLTLSLSGNNVMVGAGGAVIGTAKGAYVCGVASTTTIGALVAADATNPRRDRVVLEILDPDNGGGAGRKAQFRIIDGTPDALAATGGGFPAAPTGPFIDLGYVDVPKSGAGSPVVTMSATVTAAAGGVVLVNDLAQFTALNAYKGLVIARGDVPGMPLERWDGSQWRRGLRVEIGQGANDPTEKKGRTTLRTNAQGDASIPLATPFGSKIVAYNVQDATDPAQLGPIIIKLTTGAAALNSLTFRAYSTMGQALGNQLIAVDWWAAGY